MSDSIYTALEVLFVVGFLLGIRMMSSAETAVKGNLLGAASMFGATVTVLVGNGIITQAFLWIPMAAGGVIGYYLAIRVSMIQVPQLVALLNGSGGGASAVVALVVLSGVKGGNVVASLTGGLTLAVGGITLSGSLIAAAKLDRKISQEPIVIKGYKILSLAAMFMTAALILLSAVVSGNMTVLLSIVILVNAFFLGLVPALRIGGADMPITISLLNSLSGLAGSLAGFAINNLMLVATGAIVGAAGLILTRIMCHAMNRTLFEVIMGRRVLHKGSTEAIDRIEANAAGIVDDGSVAAGDQDKYNRIGPIIKHAKNVVIIPGYGMALSQAQGLVNQLFKKLEKQGKEVKFAIHPVAGRMPGQMYALLAAVGVPYEKLFDKDVINPTFKETDVVIIVGANDVVNPAALTAEGTPIYGMPILKADEAKKIIICNLDSKPGYAGVANPLYRHENVILMLGDARETIVKLMKEIA